MRILKTFERVTITGSMVNIGKEIDALVKDGYTITHSGPIKSTRHNVDATRFIVVAEKEVGKNKETR